MIEAGREEVKRIRESGYFDETWYVDQYPDVSALGLDPIEHYLSIGALLQRDPSPKFDTSYYLSAYPDIVAAGVNPLLHYIEYGQKEGRSPVPNPITRERIGERIDIVVPVFNALDDVKKCLESLRIKHDGFIVQVFVVNDGSDEQTTGWLRQYCSSNENFTLLEHQENCGYTKSVNSGLRASSSPYVILQNSDTIVTRGWLKAMVRCICSASSIGIVGPLSNAASWQSIPILRDPKGGFFINSLPPEYTPDDMAEIVSAASQRIYPRVPFVNGFCFMIRREVIDAIGYMDEQNFPVGYGEENDYCIRAADAGFQLAIADDSYVFHAKSKSFGHESRQELSAKGSAALNGKHTNAKVSALIEQVKNIECLDRLRVTVAANIDSPKHETADVDIFSKRILFLLPVHGGGGGAHSVVQEVVEMRRLGVDAKVAIKRADYDRYLKMYDDVPHSKNLFLAIDFSPSAQELSIDYDVIIATIYHSISYLKDLVERYPHIMPCYYVQDYEPLFFAPNTEPWTKAIESYTAIPEAVLFAKTYWIAKQIKSQHGIPVHKVEASIDHSVYYPKKRSVGERITLSAMIRPQTPYRGAARTMRVFSRLSKEFGNQIAFDVFGCSPISPLLEPLLRDFEYVNHGVLSRPEVASVLRSADVFVDLSDYQAFGRTALEAMACGCAAVVPVAGGSDDYALDGVNALVVDTFNEDEVFARLRDLIQNRQKLREMQRASLVTASRYSVTRAAISELNLFSQKLGPHRTTHPVANQNKLYFVPDVRGDNKPAGSAHVRILMPYKQNGVLKDWQVTCCAPGALPDPTPFGVAIIQRAPAAFSLAKLSDWLVAWREAKGTFIYEIDDDLFDEEGLRQRRFRNDIGEVQRRVEWLARNADIVTVSTERLAQKLRAYNNHVVVVPNFLDSDLWQLERARDHSVGPYSRQENVVKIGYIGTGTHTQDLAVIADAVKKIESEFGAAVEFEVIGAFQNVTPLFGKKVGLPKNTEYPDFVDWLIKRVHWDIGLIPLADDAFNKSKSHLKFLEYAALDMAIICSNTDAYREVARDRQNCLVVENDVDAWYNGLKELIINESLRKTLADNAAAMLRERYTTVTNLPLYVTVLTNNMTASQQQGEEA